MRKMAKMTLKLCTSLVDFLQVIHRVSFLVAFLFSARTTLNRNIFEFRPQQWMTSITNCFTKQQSNGQNRTSQRRSEFSITKAKLTSIPSWFIKSSMFLGCNESQPTNVFSPSHIFQSVVISWEFEYFGGACMKSELRYAFALWGAIY